jgi:predicted glycosyltransferase
MRILVEVTHPAHVHFFRNAIAEFQRRGHCVAVTAKEKDVTIDLLKNYEIPYTLLNVAGSGKLAMPKRLLVRDYLLWKFCREFKPDVLTGIAGVFAAHVGFFLRKPSVIWDDTEHHKYGHMLTWPFATAIYSPACYLSPPKRKQHFYAGCHELAYLHPKRFTPNVEIVKQVGINPDQKYCIIRFVSWGAFHDIGQYGFTEDKKLQFVKVIAEYAKCYITSEGPLPAPLKTYQLKIPAHRFHHVLAFASLCVTEGATVASEAAVLGTPVVYINTLKAGCLNMFEKYGLLKQAVETDKALDLGLARLKDEQTQEKCRDAREKFLADKTDVTGFIVEAVEQVAGQKTAPVRQQNQTSSQT